MSNEVLSPLSALFENSALFASTAKEETITELLKMVPWTIGLDTDQYAPRDEPLDAKEAVVFKLMMVIHAVHQFEMMHELFLADDREVVVYAADVATKKLPTGKPSREGGVGIPDRVRRIYSEEYVDVIEQEWHLSFGFGRTVKEGVKSALKLASFVIELTDAPPMNEDELGHFYNPASSAGVNLLEYLRFAKENKLGGEKIVTTIRNEDDDEAVEISLDDLERLIVAKIPTEDVLVELLQSEHSRDITDVYETEYAAERVELGLLSLATAGL